MRNELSIFAQYMEHKLKLNDHKGGWDDKPLPFLVEKLKGEVAELEEAIANEPGLNIMFEAADIANFAMMIAWNVMRSQVQQFTGGQNNYKKIRQGLCRSLEEWKETVEEWNLEESGDKETASG